MTTHHRAPRRLTLVAAVSTLLAALPVGTLFNNATWALHAAFVVAAMCAAGLLVRSVRAPSWAPTPAMALAGLLVLTWSFRSGHEYAGILPSPGTFAHFRDLLRTAAADLARFAPPVTDREGLMFLAVLGVAAVALLVDQLAVVQRQPALAGLPMLAVYAVPVTASSASTSWLPFVLGAAGFLWLLGTDSVDRIHRFGRRLGSVGPRTPSPLAAAGRRLGAAGVGLAVLVPLVPFALPGIGLDRPRCTPAAGTARPAPASPPGPRRGPPRARRRVVPLCPLPAPGPSRAATGARGRPLRAQQTGTGPAG
ncbi:DUF3488 domain-containing protein [Dactylosporangium sp. CA-152071]|uniref:DUF3488 domain-containing protein n=1 Tax=Dactylosporangium sp. CA-152071 TaxID=3239933 RepID=UPI003D8E61B8